jgi:hypothetical protein
MVRAHKPLVHCERVVLQLDKDWSSTATSPCQVKRQERNSYWLIATPLKAGTPIDFDVATDVRSP